MTALRSPELDFLNEAPVRLHRTATVGVSKARLFAVIAEKPPEWGRWCPGFTTASRWTTSGPPAVGSKRTMRAFGTDFHETVLAFDEGARFAFRLDECVVPAMKAFVEDWTFEAVEEGTTPKTRVTWSMAADSALPVAVMSSFITGFQILLMTGAVRRLERRYGGS
ncbi:SRPBCC family protein [Mycobacterium sp. MMS18-G62]